MNKIILYFLISKIDSKNLQIFQDFEIGGIGIGKNLRSRSESLEIGIRIIWGSAETCFGYDQTAKNDLINET